MIDPRQPNAPIDVQLAALREHIAARTPGPDGQIYVTPAERQKMARLEGLLAAASR